MNRQAYGAHGAGGTPSSHIGSQVGTGDPTVDLLAATEVGLLPDQALDTTIRQLDNVAKALTAGADQHELERYLNSVTYQAQTAQSLLHYFHPNSATDPVDLSHLQNVPDALKRWTVGAQSRPGYHWSANELLSLVAQVRELANTLEKLRASQVHRDEWLRQFNPDAVDPDYRDPMERYFELLSREPAR